MSELPVYLFICFSSLKATDLSPLLVLTLSRRDVAAWNVTVQSAGFYLNEGSTPPPPSRFRAGSCLCLEAALRLWNPPLGGSKTRTLDPLELVGF